MLHPSHLAALALAVIPLNAQIEVGQGSPDQAIQWRFAAAYNRNGFNALVALPPVTAVQKFGTTGLQQQFYDTVKTSGVRLALVKADAAKGPGIDPVTGQWVNDVYQVTAAMNAYYTSVTAATAGFPTMDTASCPALDGANCSYQFFDKNYVLFVHPAANYSLRDPFFTAWTAAGGVNVMGGANSAEAASTSPITASAATLQSFQRGALFNITTGLQRGMLLTVKPPFHTFYVLSGGWTGALGFPTANEVMLSDGRRRQTFEGGALEATVEGVVTLKSQVAQVTILAATGQASLAPGQTLTLTARLQDASGALLTDRTIGWQTSNGRVATVVGSGSQATVTGVGNGTALITAISEGRTSAPFTVTVVAPCCAPGEGAPTAALQQAFADTLVRNRLSVKLPSATAVRRSGPGYLQEFVTTGAPSQRLVVAVSDTRVTGQYLTGPILAAYETLGGTTGLLGYPVSDPTPAGRQSFLNHAALAGTPLHLVNGAIHDRWAAWNYETGAAGQPVSDASGFLTFNATSGQAQAFQNGVFYTALAGPAAGRTVFVRGAILQKYLELGGTGGEFGLALADEIVIDGRRRQEFEGGNVEADLADTQATATPKSRQPSFTATPNPVLAGGRVRLALGGFPAGSTLRVTAGSQPEFQAEAPGGAFAWESSTAGSARSSSVTVRAVTSDGKLSVIGTYQIKALADARLALEKMSGDGQTGAPGAVLPVRLRVLLRDSAGAPAAGVPITFQASPGAVVVRPVPATGVDGTAEASLRLPSYEGVALMTASAPGLVVTFTARGVASSLHGFPAQSGEATGAMTAAVSSLLRFHQERGEIGAPNGLSDPVLLESWLRNTCPPDAGGVPVCDGLLPVAGSGYSWLNLSRVLEFAGGGARWVNGEAHTDWTRDSVAAGIPVLVALNLSASGVPAGTHFVVATGISAGGAVVIHDPLEGRFRQTTLDAFLAGFQLDGQPWRASMSGAFRLQVEPEMTSGFVVHGATAFQLAGVSGTCGPVLTWLDRAADPLTGGLQPANSYHVGFCDGLNPPFQLDVAEPARPLAFLASGTPTLQLRLESLGWSSYRIERGGGAWEITRQTPAFLESDAVLNAASQSSLIAPGTLVLISGQGLRTTETLPSVSFDGQQAVVVEGSSFRLSAVVPDALPVGPAILSVTTLQGSIAAPVELQAVAPAIFVLGSGRQAAALNADGTVNAPANPARRGTTISLYATGLGAPAAPVTVQIGSLRLRPAYAGPAPTLPGVHQVNVALPASMPPGEGQVVVLEQGGSKSPAVAISIE